MRYMTIYKTLLLGLLLGWFLALCAQESTLKEAEEAYAKEDYTQEIEL